MAGLVPAIHDLSWWGAGRTWMPGTSPGMTTLSKRRNVYFSTSQNDCWTRAAALPLRAETAFHQASSASR